MRVLIIEKKRFLYLPCIQGLKAVVKEFCPQQTRFQLPSSTTTKAQF